MAGQTSKLTIRYWDVEDRAPGPQSPEYEAVITFVKAIDMSDLKLYLEAQPTDPAANYHPNQAITALNTIIAKTPTNTPGIFVFGGNRFYNYPMGQSLNTCLDLGGGLIAVRGYYASARVSTLRTLVNVHTQTSAFYAPGSVYDLMKLHGFSDVHRLGIFLRKLRVKTSYLKAKDGKTIVEKVKTVIRISQHNARGQTFISDQGRQINVEQYFLQSRLPQVKAINLCWGD